MITKNGASGIKSFDFHSSYIQKIDFHWRNFLLLEPKEKLRFILEKAKVAKGITKAGRDKPDFLVAFHIGAQNKVDVTTYGYRYGPRGRRWGRQVNVQRYKEGTLILDFVDDQSRQLVWRGTVVDAVYRPEDLGDKLNAAVGKILGKYPPQ